MKNTDNPKALIELSPMCEDLEEWLQAEAERLHLSSSELVEAVLYEYMAAKNEHGRRVKWPPEFVHFLKGTKTNQS